MIQWRYGIDPRKEYRRKKIRRPESGNPPRFRSPAAYYQEVHP